jgi:uncharacterized membrane protein YphA (DoxX/SURF4 family)
LFFHIDFIIIRLFIRLFLGIIFCSSAISKLARPRHFRRSIQEYRVIPALLETKQLFSTVLSFSIPSGELVAGLGLISGILLTPSSILICGLLFTFCAAMACNLVRGRHDLSCHCGGTLGNHQISWWLVGRNLALIAMVCVLPFTPSDQWSFDTFLREPILFREALFTTIFPVVLVVVVVLVQPRGSNAGGEGMIE